MQLGFHLGPVVLAGQDTASQRREHIDQVRSAADHGFGSFSVGTHVVVHPFQYFNIYPRLARLTSAAPDLDVVSSVVLPRELASAGVGQVDVRVREPGEGQFSVLSTMDELAV